MNKRNLAHYLLFICSEKDTHSFTTPYSNNLSDDNSSRYISTVTKQVPVHLFTYLYTRT